MPELDDSTSDPFQLCGTTIEGKYRIASVIGDGGFGVVYRGVHQGFGEVIAVKCLKLPRALDGKQRDGFLEQLRDEGRLLHRLSKATPGIVQALDVGAVTTPSGQWVPYLVLEWLDGETLADHIAARLAAGDGPFPLVEAIRLLEPAARALAVAHSLKVAHRDVKPHNLFLAKVGEGRTLKVLDFGIAKVLTDYPTFTEALAATNAGPTAFTPRYGAPEQFNKQRGASGPWTDVFALALIFVELVTGKKALEGDDPTQLYISAADPTVRPTARTRGAEVPDAVERVLDKALAIEPKNRYADAGELLEALLEAAGLAPAAAMRPRTSAPSPTTPMADSASVATVDYVARAKLAGAGSAGSKLDATRPVESLVGAAAPLAAVVVKPVEPTAPASPPTSPPTSRGPATVASPGAEPRRPGDPMSETPFFNRHQLPPSVPAAKLEQAAPPVPAAPARALWPIVVIVVLATLGAAAAVLAGGESKPPPAVAASGSASKVQMTPVHAHDAGALDASAAPTTPDASSASAAEPGAPPVEMVLVAPGTLKMGEGASEREVTVSRPFYLDRAEVTVRAYEACQARRMCAAADHVALPPGYVDRWSAPLEADATDAASGAAAAQAADYAETWSRRCNAPRGAGEHPINCVDFASAEAFCRWAGKRLPTEAEWELAARGVEGRAYPWGADAPECGRACYDKNGACLNRGDSVATCAAGLHPADRTPEGIYDLGGDVSEWVSDGFTEKPTGGKDPRGDPAAALRVVRGGSFIDQDDKLKATFRAGVPPGAAHVAIGLRCAMDTPGDAGSAKAR